MKFIVLYCSAAEGRMNNDSDMALCIYYADSPEEASRFMFNVLKELFSDLYDVQIYQQLPLYVRVEALKGKLIYNSDTRFSYGVTIETIKDFDDFKQ